MSESDRTRAELSSPPMVHSWFSVPEVPFLYGAVGSNIFIYLFIYFLFGLHFISAHTYASHAHLKFDPGLACWFWFYTHTHTMTYLYIFLLGLVVELVWVCEMNLFLCGYG